MHGLEIIVNLAKVHEPSSLV